MNNLEEVKAVSFMGCNLMAAKTEDGTIYAGVSYICNGMGMNKNEKDRQIKNVQSDEVISSGCVKFDAGVFDPNNTTVALKLDYIPLWLAKISITPAMKAERPQLAERLIQYQLKAKDALAAAFIKKRPATMAEQLLEQAKLMVEQERRIKALEDGQEQMQNAVQQTMDIFAAPSASPDDWAASLNHQINTIVETFGGNHRKFRGDRYAELELEAGVDLTCRQTRLRNRMRKSGATETECKQVSKLQVIARDRKLRPIFEGIIRREYARLVSEKKGF